MAGKDPDSAAERLTGMAADLAARLAAYGEKLKARPLETDPAEVERDVRRIGGFARTAKSILLLEVLEDRLAAKALAAKAVPAADSDGAGPANDPANDDVEPAPVSKKTLPHEDPERAARLYARLDARVAELAEFFESKGVARGPVPGRLGREAERVGWREPAQQPDAPA